METLDENEYPTEEYLEFIRTWSGDKCPFNDFLILLEEAWWMSEWGFKLKRPYGGTQTLELHTGGWSSNEEIIQAIKSNIMLTHFNMRYFKWITGGHYYFKIRL